MRRRDNVKKPAHFSIEGLFGVKTVDLPIEKNALILVGPNGAGKSTVTNIFYFFMILKHFLEFCRLERSILTAS